MIDFGIIAAGDGNRIRQEGSPLPKPLVEIQGMPMIGRLINIMESCGANSISIIVNSGMPEVMNYLVSLKENLKCELKLLDKKTPSSMHTFYELLKLMNPTDKFVVTTVDTIFRKEDFMKYVECLKYSSVEYDGVMGVTEFIDDEKPLYVDVDSQMNIFGYKDDFFEGVKYVSAGIYGLRQSALPILSQCVEQGMSRMRNFQRSLISSGLKLKAYNLGKVIDVDHLPDIEKANAFLGVQ